MEISKSKATELINEKISQFNSILDEVTIQKVLRGTLQDNTWEKAYHGTINLLTQLFSEQKAENFRRNVKKPAIAVGGVPPAEKLEYFKNHIRSCIAHLEIYKETLEISQFTSENKTAIPSKNEKKVFIVHGHDEGLKNQLEIFLTEIGLESVVLHRKPDEGLTIIEKFEKHSNVGYAFILLTPDDIAYPISEEKNPDEKKRKEKRARQNVIWEFGFFVGKLGRNKVCCLYKEGVTLPTDVSGMLYKKIKDKVEDVALDIQKDLRAVGYDVTPITSN